MYSCWFTCNQDQNEIKQSRPSKTYNQVIKHAVFSVTIKSTRVLLVRLDPIKICTHAHSRACMLVTLHVCISKVSIHLDLGRRWINSCILGDYPLFFYSILDLFLHTGGIYIFVVVVFLLFHQSMWVCIADDSTLCLVMHSAQVN